MVTTRSGHDVFYTQASYGRAAKKEATRRRLKRKLESTLLHDTGEEGGVDRNTTPRRQTRAQIRQLEELDTPPSALTRVAITPPSVTERFLRGRTPTCSDYGTSRNILFQGNDFFFCSPCNLWDSLPPDRDKRCSRVSLRFACIAKHKCFSHPTTLCDSYGRMRKDSEELVAPGEIITTQLNVNSDCSTVLAESLTARSDSEEEHDQEDSAGYDDNSVFAAGFVDSTASLCDNSENTATFLDNQPLPVQLRAGEGPSTQQDSVEELKRKVQVLRTRNRTLARELKKLRGQEAATTQDTRYWQQSRCWHC